MTEDVTSLLREWADDRLAEHPNALTAAADELDELAAEVERLEGELQDERIARLEVDNRVAHLEAAIELHRQCIRSLDFGVNGRAADEALWWWVQ